MKTKQKIFIVLLILGLIFSSLLRVRFNVSNGFDFQNFWIKFLPLPIFDFGGSTNELVLTTTFLGYLFFVISSFFMPKNIKTLNVKNLGLIAFSLLTILAIVFEGSSIIQDLNSNFTGQHFRIGPTLFIIGILIFRQDYRMSKNSKP